MFRRVCLSSLMLVIAIAFAGCRPKAESDSTTGTTPASPTTPAAESEDHHHGEGPHGGTIADWGGGAYHVEFTVDHDKKESAVYILGSDGKSPAPVKAEKLVLSINEPAFQVDLMPQPLEGEAEGASSRFVGQHESLGIVREFAGTITGDVEGTPYAAEFAEAPHTHEK